MKIYSFPTFNVTKILFTAEELQLDYQFELVSPMKGEHKTAEHLQRHPLGKVPAIEYKGESYFESNAICRLLADDNHALYADTAAQRAVINQWVDMVSFHAGRWMGVLFFEEVIKANMPGREVNPDNIVEAKEFLQQQLPALNSQLKDNAFIAGSDISIADTIAFAYCQTTEYTSLDLSAYEHINRWYESINQRPSIGRALAHLPKASINPFG